MRLLGRPRRNVARFNGMAGSQSRAEPLECRTLLSVADFALDPAFGQGGRAALDVAGEPSDAAATPDGKLVVGGGGFLLRFNADGSRDASFGDNGLVRIDRLEGVTRVAVQADGKVLAADETMEPIDDHDLYRNPDIGVMRFNADGTPDTSFGNNGMARLNFGGASQHAEHVAELIVTPRGKIVVVGTTPTEHFFTYPPGHPIAGEKYSIPREDIAVGRLNPDGTPDETFGIRGKRTIGVADYSVYGTAFYGTQGNLTPDGKVVVSANLAAPMHNNDPAWPAKTVLAELDRNGDLDESFGEGGLATYPMGELGLGPVNDLAVANDGHLYVAGSGPGAEARLTRFDRDGSLDDDFGDGGRLKLGTDPTQPNGLQLQKVWPQSDGSILMTAGALFPCVVRVGADGTVLGKASGQGLGLVPPIQMGITVPLTGGKLIVVGNDVTRLTVSPDAVTWPGPAARPDPGPDPDPGPRPDPGPEPAPEEPPPYSTQAKPGEITADPAFGKFGQATYDVDGLMDIARSSYLLPDGKLLVGGESDLKADHDRVAAMVRLNADGSLDRSFGAGGKVALPLMEVFSDITVQADGKILATGDGFGNWDGGGDNLGVARFNPDGTLDTTFASGGVFFHDFHGGTDWGGNHDWGQRIRMVDGGKIVVSGTTESSYELHFSNGGDYFHREDLAVVRINPDGTLDNGFGEGGQVVLSFGEWAVEGDASLAVAADGSLLIGGTSYAPSLEVPSSTDFRRKIIARLTPAGALDPAFGNGGVIHDNQGIYVDDLAALPDGSVVAEALGTWGLSLLKYRPDGTTDTSFGDGGHATFEPPKSGGYGSTFAALADGTFRTADVSELGWHAATFGADGKLLEESNSADPPPRDRAAGMPVLTRDGRMLALSFTPGKMVADPVTGKLNVTNDVSDGVVWRFDLGLAHDAPVLERTPTPAPPGADVSAASAVFAGKPLTKAGRAYTFRVQYRGMDANALSVIVKDSTGAVVPVKVVKVKRSRGGPPTVAVYRIRVRGRAPAGPYTVHVARGAVGEAGAMVGEVELIGSFEVRRGGHGRGAPS